MKMETIAISRYLQRLLKINTIFTVLVLFNHNIKYIMYNINCAMKTTLSFSIRKCNGSKDQNKYNIILYDVRANDNLSYALLL